LDCTQLLNCELETLAQLALMQLNSEKQVVSPKQAST